VTANSLRQKGEAHAFVSAILKKVNTGKAFIRKAPKTFALKERHTTNR
jgi:hypothetical protein